MLTGAYMRTCVTPETPSFLDGQRLPEYNGVSAELNVTNLVGEEAELEAELQQSNDGSNWKLVGNAAPITGVGVLLLNPSAPFSASLFRLRIMSIGPTSAIVAVRFTQWRRP